MNRKEFLTTLVGAPISGVAAVNAIQSTGPTYTLVKPSSYEEGHRQLFWDDRPIGYPNTTAKWTKECLLDMGRQLQKMVWENPRCIYFVPHSKDEEAFSQGFGKKYWSAHRDDHIIGNLTEVKFITESWEFKSNGMQSLGVKFQIDDQFNHLPIRFYNLAVGTDPATIVFDDYDLNEMYEQKKYDFTIKSCKVNGLHLTLDSHPNYPWEDHTRIYYKLCGLNMFIYLPGRCYW